MKKTLVAYFSATGTTKRTAQAIAKATGGVLHEIEPRTPYSSDDLNWHDSRSRSSIESKDRTCRPGIANAVSDMEGYDVVFVGFPIWWYGAPTIINTFLESYDFSGKTVVPFATSGGSNLGSAEQGLKASCGSRVAWKPGRCFFSGCDAAQARVWIEGLGL